MDRYPVLIVGARPDVVQRLVAALGQQQVRSAERAADALAGLQKAQPATAVVSLGADRSLEPLQLVRDLTAQGVSVIAMGARSDAESILAAMRAGAREYVADGQVEELDKAVHRFLETSGLRLGTITAVVPVKGGMGATTLRATWPAP